MWLKSLAVQQCSPDVHDILVLERTSHWYSQPSRVSFKFTKQGLKFYRQLAMANVSPYLFCVNTLSDTGLFQVEEVGG